jgi:transcriptional regulator with XRE-family HTH domain
MEPLRIRLGHTVRELRASAGYSQESFAAKIKVHRTFMGTIERGKTNPSLDTIERLAKGLGLSVWELMRAAERFGAASTRDRIRGPGSYDRRGKTDRETAALRKIAEERDR